MLLYYSSKIHVVRFIYGYIENELQIYSRRYYAIAAFIYACGIVV